MEPLVVLLTLAVIAAVVLVERHQQRSPGPHPTLPKRPRAKGSRTAYPGDYTGRVKVRYSPSPQGQPDPGEIVWTWVPFEEDHSQGKDRPVLIIGHDNRWLLGLQLTSSAANAQGRGKRSRELVTIGTGPWDPKRRPSAVRLDRIVRVDPHAVRREGAVLDRNTFNDVAHSLSAHRDW